MSRIKKYKLKDKMNSITYLLTINYDYIIKQNEAKNEM